MTPPVIRIHVTELDFMPERHRWAVDFFPEGKPQKYYSDLTKFLPTEELAIAFAEESANNYGLVRIGEHTWALSADLDPF